ncbi:hypothetical protein ATPR_2332 [Acetobacter tropicalis NBRC 101654]|uniref:Uncharacterized protein n=1 Tax=Acetobacter tropicalis NBRC 101654 TaxID=749388 RepID=F7VG33_9PROT|nr:hypothetical protein ATPR_2332 [Acetobacter tropicalis NBRC 101654]
MIENEPRNPLCDGWKMCGGRRNGENALSVSALSGMKGRNSKLFFPFVSRFLDVRTYSHWS